MAKTREKEQTTVEEKKEQPAKVTSQKENNPNKKKGKSGVIIVLVLFLSIIGFGIAVLGFNAFNIREKYLRNTIQKIPIVKNLLSPENTDELTLTSEELEAKISELEKEITNQNNTITTLTNNNNSLGLENKRLKEIESQQLEFKIDKEEFDKRIALNDPEAYSAFYEKISPENAEALYTTAKISAEQKKELNKYTETFDTIDTKAGAKVLEELVQTDIDLVVLILNNIDSEQRANLLAAMDTAKAAMVVKRLAPNTITTGQQ